MRRRNPSGPFEPPTTITEAAVRELVDLAVHEFSYISTAMAADLVTLAARFESTGDARLAEVARQGMALLMPGDHPPTYLQAIQLAEVVRKAGLMRPTAFDRTSTEWWLRGWREHLPALWQMRQEYVAAETGPGVPGLVPAPFTTW